MSDETKCRACGDSGWVPSELGGSVPCGCGAPRMFLGGVFVSTPPTPDPRERGEEDAIRAEFGWKRDPRPLIECIRERVNAGDDARDALRAPAPSEAVAWTLSAPMLGGVSALATFLSDSEEDAIKRASAGQPLEGWTVTPLYTHPAPARGVTVTEAMAKAAAKKASALWNEDGAAYDEFWDDIKDEWIAILTAALTPDAT